jgi:hypothetical protein
MVASWSELGSTSCWYTDPLFLLNKSYSAQGLESLGIESS